MHYDNELRTVRVIVDHHLRMPSDIDDNTPLISGGYLDSMAFVDLLLCLEEALGVRLSPQQIQVEDFDTIRLIAQTVARLRSGKAP